MTGIILLAFGSLGHALEPRVLDDPLVVAIARRLRQSPAQVLLAWGVQWGTAVLTNPLSLGAYARISISLRFLRARCTGSINVSRLATDSILL